MNRNRPTFGSPTQHRCQICDQRFTGAPRHVLCRLCGNPTGDLNAVLTSAAEFIEAEKLARDVAKLARELAVR